MPTTEAILDDLLASLPKGHPDVPGVRRALEVLKYADPEPRVNTKEENIAFRKDWDRRYEEGIAR